MPDRSKRLLEAAGMLLILALTAVVLYVLLLYPGDISAQQTENRKIFGATYMTMNNPYYHVLDSQLRAEIEARGDVLLTRDAAMDQMRQNQEVRDLIEEGAQAIFLTPVEWDTVREGLEAANRAGVPVIVVDAPVQDAELVACSVLSDNYQAGILCAEHLVSQRDSAKIILLEHITARSGAERVQGFVDTIQGHDGFSVLASGESDGQIENAMPVMEELLRQNLFRLPHKKRSILNPVLPGILPGIFDGLWDNLHPVHHFCLLCQEKGNRPNPAVQIPDHLVSGKLCVLQCHIIKLLRLGRVYLVKGFWGNSVRNIADLIRNIPRPI